MTGFKSSNTALPDVWQSLRREAEDVIDRESDLSGLLEKLILKHPSLGHALSDSLSDALEFPAMGKAAIEPLLNEITEDNPYIVTDSSLDLVAVQANDPACETFLHAFMNYKGFHALQVYRIAHRLWLDGRREIANLLSNRASRVFGADIHPAACLGSGIMLDHGSGIVIGETAVIGDDVTILQNVTLGGTGKILGDRHPKVRQGVMIGAGANIIGNIEIGAFSKIGAGSVVLKDVPAGCTVVGIPAQVVRRDSKQTTFIGMKASSENSVKVRSC